LTGRGAPRSGDRPQSESPPDADASAVDLHSRFGGGRMRAWLAAHRHALRSALAQFSRRPAASLFEAAVFGIALALPLGFLVIVENVRALAERHPATPEISVFLVRAATAADIDRIGERLRGIRESESVRFVSRADAAERLRRSVALAEVLNALPENPLPDAFTLRLQEADAGRLE